MGQEEVDVAQERTVYSDLSFSGVSLDIAVFSPLPRGINEFILEAMMQGGEFSHIASDVRNFTKMVHWGMLTCSGATSMVQSQGEPLEFVPCGGPARLDGDTIVCDACNTAFSFIGSDFKNLRNIMFYLMLKQMVPDMRFCNFVDCSLTPESKRFAYDNPELEAIRSLGVVAVHRCLLYLSPGAEGVRHAGLGFMFAPEMRTRTKGLRKFGPWLQYLMCEWYNRIKASEDDTREFRYGPKPVRD